MTIDYIGPAGSFADKTMSIADVIDGQAAPEKLSACRDRYVLIGATAAAMGDRVASPFASFASKRGDRNGSLISGVEVSANAITTILRSRFYRETPDWVAALIAALIAAVVIGSLILAQGGRELIRQIAALLGITGLILGLSYLAFVHWMIAPPLISAIVSLIVAAPLALLLRSLTASASLDDRIAEMTLESARLSPFAIEGEPKSAEAVLVAARDRPQGALSRRAAKPVARADAVFRPVASIGRRRSSDRRRQRAHRLRQQGRREDPRTDRALTDRQRSVRPVE